jgi:signal transduction histidine kinase
MPIHAHGVTVGDVQVLDSLRRRMRAVDPFKLDVAIAAAFVVVAVIELSHLDPEGRSRPVTIAAAVVAMAALAFRRRNAVLAAVIFAAPTVLQAFLDGYMTKNSTTPFVGLLFLLYSIGRYAETRRLRDALLVLIPSMILTLTVEVGWDGPADLVWICVLFGLPVLAGRALRSRQLLQAELREKAEVAERDREGRAQAAVEYERVRIATELQELVANGLSTMVVQAGAVPRAVSAGDTARAGTALAAVESTGREALTEMRTLLGVLRREGDAAKLAPQPGLARLEALAERNRERGLAVTLDLHGWGHALPAGIDLTAYRVVEDALGAAVEQGAEQADVLVRYKPRELQLQVTDDRAGGDSDRLAGLRDRVGLYGGHLRAERTGERAFRVRATLPLEEEGS